MTRQDLLTQETFIAKRSNQKFATRANQRLYNRIKANKIRTATAYVNRPLHKNYKLLNEMLNDDTEAIFHKQYMLGAGFDFKVYTHMTSVGDKFYHSCYNFILIPVDSVQIKIIKEK